MNYLCPNLTKEILDPLEHAGTILGISGYPAYSHWAARFEFFLNCGSIPDVGKFAQRFLVQDGSLLDDNDRYIGVYRGLSLYTRRDFTELTSQDRAAWLLRALRSDEPIKERFGGLLDNPVTSCVAAVILMAACNDGELDDIAEMRLIERVNGQVLDSPREPLTPVYYPADTDLVYGAYACFLKRHDLWPDNSIDF